jgi:hypothetical protein
MRRLELTEQTVCCPLEGRTAVLTLRSDPDGYPSRRHVDVEACSLLLSTPRGAPTRSTYCADLAPPVPYVDAVDPAPRHASNIACSKRCLAVLNAVESSATGGALACTSGVADAMELARRVQSPAMTRLLWFYGG